MYTGFLHRCLLVVCLACLWWVSWSGNRAQAEDIDPYIRRYLQVTEPVALTVDEQGNSGLFSPNQFLEGKQLFQQHCLNCHVGGATLPAPQVSLSLSALKGAMPPRDNINALVAYMRQPMSYDGSELNFWCREVPETWLPDEQVNSIAAFILRAAQKAPGWGSKTFEKG
ncbi:MAG TPA: photosystem II cytochrome PsbV2 [Oscillatoriaceae cyanobacterium M33_DOE_052]|uniref:Photosystem II cytochrome PsbV2 n=1 Tax=Planktothricoides sp. SpSt-374 TaxID=2282167 RepID=A0A7C3VQZ7_9CYAN|nr:photosystem II cytochrome PsbV2 [Oscillatoriaceae cyanobacterium M33_DOE_052]